MSSPGSRYVEKTRPVGYRPGDPHVPAAEYVAPVPATSVAWSSVTGKPSVFPAAPHSHDDRYPLTASVNASISRLDVEVADAANELAQQTFFLA